MVAISSAENAARRLLTAFSDFGAGPGHGLEAHHLGGLFSRDGWRLCHLEVALGHALDKGWVRQSVDDTLLLTRTGFLEMRGAGSRHALTPYGHVDIAQQNSLFMEYEEFLGNEAPVLNNNGVKSSARPQGKHHSGLLALALFVTIAVVIAGLAIKLSIV